MGRTSDFGSGSGGSNPPAPTPKLISILKAIIEWVKQIDKESD